MNWIADLWWVWVLGFIATIVVGIHNQVKRMHSVMSDNGNVFKGIYVFFGAGILNMVFSVLLVVAIVLHIIEYAKH